MNKIFKKCGDFGIAVRLKSLTADNTLATVSSLKKAHLPLCIISIEDYNNWLTLLETMNREDLFIGVEGITSLKDAYSAVANGAQFFILKNADLKLAYELTENGFYFIPEVISEDDIHLLENLNIRCILTPDNLLYENNSIYMITNNKSAKALMENELFQIIDLNDESPEKWANEQIRRLLGLNFVSISLNINETEEKRDFAKLFSKINCCSYYEKDKNIISLECSDMDRTINHLKWKDIYVDPSTSIVENDKIISGFLDRKIYGFEIKIKEKL